MDTSASSIIGGGFRLLRERPAAVLVWVLAYLAIIVGSAFAARPYMGMRANVPGGDPVAALANMQAMMGPFLLIQLVAFALYIVLYAASQRAVLRPAEPGIAFIRFGMDELRLVGLSLFLIVAFYIAAVIAVFIIAMIAGIFGVAGGVGAAIVIGVIGAAVLIGAVVWLCVRLSLAFPLTLLRERIVIGESWRLTKGRFWPLFGGYFAIWLILVLIALVVAAITAGAYWADLMGSGFTPEGIEAAAQRQIDRQFSMSATAIIGWILKAMLGGLSIALFGGAVATAARDLTEDADGIAGTFA